jgi:heterodisulfide reductase subunit C
MNEKDIKRLFEILKELHVKTIDEYIFEDASRLLLKYHEEINMDLVDWTTAVFIRDLEKALEEVKLLSRNLIFDRLADYQNEAIAPVRRVEL